MNLEMETSTTFCLYKNQTFLHPISVLKLYMNIRHPPSQAWDRVPPGGRWSVRWETKPPDAIAHPSGETSSLWQKIYFILKQALLYY